MSQERITYPPLVAHGPDNKGAIVVVISYSLMFITILFASLRTWISFWQERDLKWDDMAFSLAVLLLIPETVLTERAVGQGLGQHISALTAPRIIQYYKYIYQSQLLGIIIQFLAKYAVVLLIERIAIGKHASHIVKIAIGVWCLFSFFTIAFQCNINQPWEFTQANCAAGGKLYYIIIVGTLVTDCVLALYFVPVIWKLQMTRSLRFLISFMFSLRLLVCAVEIPYLVLFHQYLSADDKTWYNTTPQILHQVIINLSVIATGILGARRFLSELQTGKLALVITNHEIEMTSSIIKSRSGNINTTKQDSRLRSETIGGGKKHGGVQSQSTRRSHSIDPSLRPDQPTSYYSAYVTGGPRKRTDHVGDAIMAEDEMVDDESTSSLKKNAVYQRRDFEIHIDHDYTHIGSGQRDDKRG